MIGKLLQIYFFMKAGNKFIVHEQQTLKYQVLWTVINASSALNTGHPVLAIISNRFIKH
jgi:glucan phosphorylase